MNLLRDPAYRCGSWDTFTFTWGEEDFHTCEQPDTHYGPHECECGHTWTSHEEAG